MPKKKKSELLLQQLHGLYRNLLILVETEINESLPLTYIMNVKKIAKLREEIMRLTRHIESEKLAIASHLMNRVRRRRRAVYDVSIENPSHRIEKEIEDIKEKLAEITKHREKVEREVEEEEEHMSIAVLRKIAASMGQADSTSLETSSDSSSSLHSVFLSRFRANNSRAASSRLFNGESHVNVHITDDVLWM